MTWRNTVLMETDFFLLIHTFLNSAYELLCSVCLSESSIESGSKL